jgi:hypothetical protein
VVGVGRGKPHDELLNEDTINAVTYRNPKVGIILIKVDMFWNAAKTHKKIAMQYF